MRAGLSRLSVACRALLLALTMAASVLIATEAAEAAATAPDKIAHTGTGRVIDVLAVGDSYMAGNAAGSYHYVSPDDPGTPPSPYSGPGCYRSYRNGASQAYTLLQSKGRYINRACSGMKTTDVIPEVKGLPGTAIGDSIDLITYSAGGNDANFGALVLHCFTPAALADGDATVTGGSISAECYRLVSALPPMLPSIVSSEEGNLRDLLKAFPRARIVMDGYPLLATQVGQLATEKETRTWNWAAGVLSQVQRNLADSQKAMVARVAADTGRTLAFNNLFVRFGTDGRHAMGSSNSWITRWIGLQLKDEVAHPNAAGQADIGKGIANVSGGWFSSYPLVSRTSPTYFHIPGNGDVTADAQGALVSIASPALGPCIGMTITVKGWVGASTGLVTVEGNGPDNIRVNCANPRAGDIVGYGTTSYLAVSSAVANPFQGTRLQRIPTAWMYDCLAAKTGVRKLRMNSFYETIARGNPDLPGRASCVPSGWRSRILVAPDNSSWLVDANGYRHWIPDTDTFFMLTAQYGAAIPVSQQVDVDTIPRGADQPPQLNASDLDGTIIRRTDGVSWVIAAGVRRHLPNHATDLCARYVERRAVSRTALTAAQAASIPEGTPWVCSLESKVLRANDTGGQRPSYAYYSGTRHWIQDTWTFDYYARRGWPVVDIPTNAEITRLADGGWEPKRLDPAAIPANTIVRRSDGVSWVVDGNRRRHHIPYAQDDVCWRDLRGYGVSATGLSAGQVSTMPEDDAWPCIIGDRIVKSDDGSSWYVDQANSRHWIPDTETFSVLAKSYAVVGPWPSGDVSQIPRGGDMTQRIDVNGLHNSVICRNDGVCWAVDANGWRHHIPTYADNVCFRWVYGWRVTRSGLTYDQANSLPEANAWGCSFNNRIIATNEGAAYVVTSDNVRHWVPDMETFYCYADRGYGVIRGMGMSEAGGIPEGGWMSQCLSPNRVLNRIVRVSDGTAYFVDGAGWWYWIPNGTVWGCLTSRYPILIYSASWTQVNSIRRERGVWANCNM